MAEDKMIRTQADRAKEEKPRQRMAFGVPTQKLAVFNKDPNYHYRWVNDEDGRIQFAEAAFYEFVSKGEISLGPVVTSGDASLGDKVCMLVGKTKFGQPLHAYLMKVKREYYEEDKDALAQLANQNDAAIREGNKGEDFYVPKSTPISLKSYSKS